MATKLGPVQIPITLDITTAERKLDELEIKVARAGNSGIGGGFRAYSPSLDKSGLSTYADKIQELRAKGRQRTLERWARYMKLSESEKWFFRLEEKAKEAAVLSRVHPKFGFKANIQSWRNTLNAGGVGALAGRAMSAMRAPASAAIAYGIASSTAKFLPEAYSLGQRLAGESMSGQITGQAGDLMKEIPQMIEHLRQQFVNLESKVMGIVSGFVKNRNLTEASMRLTGQLPHSDYYQRMFSSVDEQDARVKAKFDTWKRREAPAATALTLINIFTRSLGR